ncbi:MAG TPA: amidohydrolase family protein [Bryobacteraceae bacterium]|jgi:N-acetylglucosamine-6-phosphate deacetylase
MKCTGQDAVSGESIELEFERSITHVDAVVGLAASEDVLAPGFIDLQVNGFAGADYNSPETSREEIAGSLRAMFSTGVTRCFPTVITGDPERMVAALRNLVRARESLVEGPAMEGFHVEGPHISAEDGPRGAHPARWVRGPDLDEFHRWQEATEGHVRIVTLSPEWPEAPRYIERITAQGVVAAIGHTGATRQQILDAVAAGATLSTHLGNGKHAALTRESTYLWDQMADDRLAASFIVDGLHLHDSFLKVALRAKGVERSVLVTDAVAPAMGLPGPYMLGEVEVELLADQRVVLRGGQRLAGSSLRMDHAVSNVMERGGVTLRDAVTMATRNPAQVGRIAGRLRGLVPGERADIVRFRMAEGRVKVTETFLGGERVFPC